jgi:hypothetical protein
MKILETYLLKPIDSAVDDLLNSTPKCLPQIYSTSELCLMFYLLNLNHMVVELLLEVRGNPDKASRETIR